VKRKRKVGLVHYYNVDKNTPNIYVACGHHMEDVRWTTGWRVSDNPPYKERREKVTCPKCLKVMAQNGIVLG
jgi:hypothetical protein